MQLSEQNEKKTGKLMDGWMLLGAITRAINAKKRRDGSVQSSLVGWVGAHLRKKQQQEKHS
jgi:uncharacterized membrane protein YeaQ/YmgE (transglycosylase-associated protein family)